MRNYERLTIEDFGKHLLESNDLDPIYVALAHSGLGPAQLRRWLLAYWCFYHSGVASFLSEKEGSEYWDWMLRAAKNVGHCPLGPEAGWPRAKERRHARGKKAVLMIEKLTTQYGEKPENMAVYCAGSNPPRKCSDVMRRAKEHYLFGDWIAFKVADMIDRCLKIRVEFDQAATFMFRDPTEAAIMLWRNKTGQLASSFPRQKEAVLEGVVTHLIGEFADYPAPPLGDRPVGLQEVETILCKWKSHVGGHYPLFNDQDEINEGMKSWTTICKTAKRFAAKMPRRG